MMESEKVWAENECGIKIVSLTEERLSAALQVMREAFYTDEPVAKGIKLSEFPESVDDLERLTVETYKDGTSLVALKDGQIVGAAFNKVQELTPTDQELFFDTFRHENCKTSLAQEYINIMVWVDSQMNVFAHYEIERLLEVMFVATASSGRRQGVGLLLVKAAMEVAKAKDLPLCTAIFSSAGSQRIGNILEWDLLHTAQVSDFQFEHQPYTKYPAEDQSLKLMAKRI